MNKTPSDIDPPWHPGGYEVIQFRCDAGQTLPLGPYGCHAGALGQTAELVDRYLSGPTVATQLAQTGQARNTASNRGSSHETVSKCH